MMFSLFDKMVIVSIISEQASYVRAVNILQVKSKNLIIPILDFRYCTISYIDISYIYMLKRERCLLRFSSIFKKVPVAVFS